MKITRPSLLALAASGLLLFPSAILAEGRRGQENEISSNNLSEVLNVSSNVKGTQEVTNVSAVTHSTTTSIELMPLKEEVIDSSVEVESRKAPVEQNNNEADASASTSKKDSKSSVDVVEEAESSVQAEVPNVDNSATENISIKENLQLFLTPEKLAREVARLNARVRQDQIQWEISSAQKSIEKATFTPEFFSSYKHQNIKEPNTIEELLSRKSTTQYDETSDHYQMGVRGQLVTGGQWSLSLNADQRESNIIVGNEENEGALTLTYRQPLLQGRGKANSMAKIKVAELSEDIDYHNYRHHLMETCGSVTQAYWMLFGTSEIVKTWGESLRLAEKTFDSVKRLADQGKATTGDVLEARTGVALRKAELLNAKSELVAVQDQILSLLNISRKDYPGISLHPYETPKPLALNLPTLEECTNNAMKNWPPAIIADLKIKREKVQTAYWENQAKPKLDFVGSYGTSSLSYKGLNEAVNDSFTSEFNNWTFGLEFSIPLSRLAQRKNLEIARLKSQQAENDSVAMERNLSNNLHSLLTQLEHTHQLYSDRLEETDLRRQLLDMERSKFDAGKSNLRDVFSVEERFIDHVREYLHSLINWKRSELSLAIADGTLLDSYNIVVLSQGDHPQDLSSELIDNP